MDPNRLLITGVSGLLGCNLARIALRRGWRVTGTVHGNPSHVAGIDECPLDLANPHMAADIIARVEPSAVVHTAAMSRPDDCGRQPDRCRQINVEGTRALARAAATAGARFALLSSDLVYGDQAGELSEATPARPLGVYAASKREAEEAALRETGGAAFVARTALIYGWGSPASEGFMQEWIARLRAGAPVRAFTDQFRCPTYVDDLCWALLRALEDGLSGVFNVAGPTLCSRYEFGLWLAGAFGLSSDLVQPSSMDKFSFSDPRPHSIHLSNSRLRTALGYRPLAPPDALARLRRLEIASEG